MNSEDFSRQAQAIYDAVPFWDSLPPEELEEFRIRLIVDLAKIGLICGYADGRFDTSESQFAAAVFSRILHGGERAANLPAVDPSDDVLRFFNAARRQELNNLTLPGLLRRYDQQEGSAAFDRLACALYRFASYLVKADGTVTPEEVGALKRVWQLIHQPEPQADPLPPMAAAATSSEHLLAELHALLGLEEVKEKVQSLANRLALDRARTERGMDADHASLHALFCGAPGSGKTRVARLLGKLLHQLGVLGQGQLAEVDASSLVACTTRRTEERVRQAVASALGGVLLIDNAQLLSAARHDHGPEAVATLLQAMDEHRDQLVVILAGRADDLQRLLAADGALRARFRRSFHFQELGTAELLQGFEGFCTASGLGLTAAARAKLQLVLAVLYDNREHVSANVPMIRSLFERTLERQANRLAGIAPISDRVLITLEEADIPPDLPADASSGRDTGSHRPAAERHELAAAGAAS